MECYAHPGVEAIGACTVCRKAICQQDAVVVQGKLVCRDDLARGAPPHTGAKTYDPNTAFLIELVGGFFGLLGLGYIYTGRTNDGVIRLICWLLYYIFAYCIILLLLAVIVGIVCIPIQLVIQIGIPLWSAYALKEQVIAAQASVLTAS
jgi:TM2 domain-containing membrane protein YozV